MACCQAQEEDLRLPGHRQPARKKTERRRSLERPFAPGSCSLADRGLALEPSPIRGMDKVPAETRSPFQLPPVLSSGRAHGVVLGTSPLVVQSSVGSSGSISLISWRRKAQSAAERSSAQQSAEQSRALSTAQPQLSSLGSRSQSARVARRRWSIHWSSSWAGGVRCASSLAQQNMTLKSVGKKKGRPDLFLCIRKMSFCSMKEVATCVASRKAVATVANSKSVASRKCLSSSAEELEGKLVRAQHDLPTKRALRLSLCSALPTSPRKVLRAATTRPGTVVISETFALKEARAGTRRQAQSSQSHTRESRHRWNRM